MSRVINDILYTDDAKCIHLVQAKWCIEALAAWMDSETARLQTVPEMLRFIEEQLEESRNAN